MTESKSVALPLGYSPTSGGGGRIRTYEAFATDLQSAPVGHFGTPPLYHGRDSFTTRGDLHRIDFLEDKPSTDSHPSAPHVAVLPHRTD